jgi:hypothetical protein
MGGSLAHLVLLFLLGDLKLTFEGKEFKDARNFMQNLEKQSLLMLLKKEIYME